MELILKTTCEVHFRVFFTVSFEFPTLRLSVRLAVFISPSLFVLLGVLYPHGKMEDGALGFIGPL